MRLYSFSSSEYHIHLKKYKLEVIIDLGTVTFRKNIENKTS